MGQSLDRGMTVILSNSKEMTHPHMMVEDPYLIKSPFATLKQYTTTLNDTQFYEHSAWSQVT